MHSRKNPGSRNRSPIHRTWWRAVSVSMVAFAMLFGFVGTAAATHENQFTNVGPTLLDLTSPDRAPYVQGTDYQVMSGSGSGDVTARLRAIDIRFTDVGGSNTNPVDTSTSGCEQADYTAAGFQAGDIALIQRGTCTFVAKVNLAIANGASAVVIFNEGQAGRTTFAFGAVEPVSIPVISVSYAVGYELYNLTRAGPVTIHVVTNTTNVPAAHPLPTSKEQCKNDGWKNYGTTFKNQGDCISFVASGGKNEPSG